MSVVTGSSLKYLDLTDRHYCTLNVILPLL